MPISKYTLLPLANILPAAALIIVTVIVTTLSVIAAQIEQDLPEDATGAPAYSLMLQVGFGH